MARDRQRAKQRQRRAERLAARRAEAAAPEAAREHELEELADLEVGAPPETVGRSDRVLEAPPNPYDAEGLDEDLDEEIDVDDGRNGGDEAAPVRGGAVRHGERHGRLVAFLIAVWAELGRVQWPDRRQLVQLTGVVLFFVLIIGGYLGGLDAIFSKLISLIL